MASSGQSDGIRVLEDFICDAMPSDGFAVPPPEQRGVNPGMHVIAELVAGSGQPPLPARRIAELHQLATADLLALVQGSGLRLSAQELLAIHDVAAERLRSGSDEARQLSREVMLVALKKSA